MFYSMSLWTFLDHFTSTGACTEAEGLRSIDLLLAKVTELHCEPIAPLMDVVSGLIKYKLARWLLCNSFSVFRTSDERRQSLEICEITHQLTFHIMTFSY